MNISKEERGMHSSLGPEARAFVSWMNHNNFDIHPNVQLRYVDGYQGHSVIASGPIEVRQKRSSCFKFSFFPFYGSLTRLFECLSGLGGGKAVPNP